MQERALDTLSSSSSDARSSASAASTRAFSPSASSTSIEPPHPPSPVFGQSPFWGCTDEVALLEHARTGVYIRCGCVDTIAEMLAALRSAAPPNMFIDADVDDFEQLLFIAVGAAVCVTTQYCHTFNRLAVFFVHTRDDEHVNQVLPPITPWLTSWFLVEVPISIPTELISIVPLCRRVSRTGARVVLHDDFFSRRAIAVLEDALTCDSNRNGVFPIPFVRMSLGSSTV